MMLVKSIAKMDVHAFLYGVLVFQTILHLSTGRGKMVEPPQRSSLWRHEEWYGKPMVATNTDDGGLNCGGYWKLHEVNHHRCGLCGDAFDNKDRPNEAGGRFSQGYIARTYYHDKNKLIDVTVDIKANIGGYFEFRLCPNNDIHKKITQECLDKNHLVINGYGYRFYVERDSVYDLQLKIPEDLTCTQCVLQWKWKGSHYWGMCDDGYGGIGCGDQEEYYNCADIAILASNETRNITNTTNGTRIHDTQDPRIHAWNSGVTKSPVQDATTQGSWDSKNAISTPSWLQDMMLVASEMGKPRKEKKHEKHKHTKSKSVTVSGAIPVLNLPNITATSIPVHNITTLHGNDTYHNVTYTIGNSTDQEVNVTEVGKGVSQSSLNESAVDTDNFDLSLTNSSNDVDVQGRGEHNSSHQWVDLDSSLNSIQNPDTGSPVVKGIPISDVFLQSNDNAKMPTENELPWVNSVVMNDNSLAWNQDVQGVPNEKETKTFWAVSNVAGSNNPKQDQFDVQNNNMNNNIAHTSDVNIESIPVTSLPEKRGKATTGTLFNLYSTTTGAVRSTQQPTAITTTDIPQPEQSSGTTFRKRIGSPGIPIFAKDFMNIMGQGTLSPSPPSSTVDILIPNSTDSPSSTVTEHDVNVAYPPTGITTFSTEPTAITTDSTTDVTRDVTTDVTTDVTITDVISTKRPKLKSAIDEFTINTENMPHILNDVTAPVIMTMPTQYVTPPPHLSSTLSSVPEAEVGSTISIPTNETENAIFESSNNTVLNQTNLTKESVTNENGLTTNITVDQTNDLYTNMENTTSIPTQNDKERVTGQSTHTESPQSTSITEMQLQTPERNTTADAGIETTSKGIISDFEISTIYTATKEPFQLTPTSTPNYVADTLITADGGKEGNVFLRKENNPDLLMQNVTDVLKKSSRTGNLQWILTGHMVDTKVGVAGIPIPTFNPDQMGGTSGKVHIHTNEAKVRASIMQTYRPRNKAEIALKPKNFSAQNKSAYRTNMFTGPSNIKNIPTTTESFIMSKNPQRITDLSANTGFDNQPKSSPSGTFDSISNAGMKEKPTPTSDIYLKPDMILPRGSISFKTSRNKSGNKGSNNDPGFLNNGQLSFGGQDIIDAGRTVGIPLSQIRPGNGGILSDGRQIISGLDFVDTDLQYETGNRTLAMSLVGNTVKGPSRPGSMTTNTKMASSQAAIANQQPVAMRQISQETPMDKIGGNSFMHPPPPSEQLSMQPNQIIEEIMGNLRPGQRSRSNQRQLG
ncbi:mucin-3A-like [Pecten maximus]|uniref:mucin-3A-like n=1 Tax=Pecten maximus TaxID=6579 RepID=UPI00145912CB|nr:mucin-3A-like [Pecten maximus]